MNTNIGTVDRILRIVFGIAAITWGVMAENYWGGIGLILLFTALVKLCPIYLPFGLSTLKNVK